jgi:hypothetical protein
MSVNEAAFVNFPKVYLCKHDVDAGYISTEGFFAKVNPRVSSHTNPSLFQIIPIRQERETFTIREPGRKINCRADFLKKLRTDESWRYVAIRCCDSKKFVSCRTATYIPLVGYTALTEYRSSTGAYECFKIEFHAGTGRYSFLSHNGLYLDTNRTFWTVACRSDPKHSGTIATNRSWDIMPLLSRSASEERVQFVGVVNGFSQDYEMQLQAEGGGLENVYIDSVKKYLLGRLKAGDSTHFFGNDLWHYCVRDKETGTGFIAIVSKHFSSAVAGECIEELALLHAKYYSIRKDSDSILEKYDLKRQEIIEKELRYLIWEYDEINENGKTDDQIRPLLEKMEENIGILYENVQNVENLKKKSEELLEQSKIFKKTAKKLKKKLSKKFILLNVGCMLVGAGVGTLAGWLIGGPVGAAIAAEQGIEIGIGAAIGLSSGALFGAAGSLTKVSMWKSYIKMTSFIR